MRKPAIFTLILSLVFAAPAMAAEGMISVKSDHGVKATADKLVRELQNKGVTVFKRINHAEGAKSVGIVIRPTVLVIFGNPKAGTPLIMCQRSVAIDLPQKALIWEDSQGQTWLGYNDPYYLALRHQIKGCEEPLERLSKSLRNFANFATTAE